MLCAVAFAATAAIPPRDAIVTAAVAAAASLLLTSIFARWDRVRMADVGAAFTLRSVPRFGAGVLIGLILVSAWLAIVTGFRSWREPSAMWAITYLILAAREELSFHGYALRRLTDRLGFWPAQILIALLFGLEHRLSGWPWTTAFAGAAVGSLLFGTAAVTTRGLAVPIGMHAAWNFGQSVVAPPNAGLTSTIVYDVIALAAVAAFLFWRRRKLIAHGEVGADRSGSGGT